MGLFGFFKGKEKKNKENQDIGRTLYQTLEETVGNYSDILLEREEKGEPKDCEELYERKKQDKRFLERIVENLNGDEEHKAKNFKSGERPDLMTKEARGVLIPAMYDDFLEYEKMKTEDFEGGKESMELGKFLNFLPKIKNFSKSLDDCLDFYLQVCKRDKKTVDNLIYGVLPKINIGDFTDSQIYMLNEDKTLGEDFDHKTLLKVMAFKNNSKVVKEGIKDNPSIPEAYEFVEERVKDIASTLDILLKKDGAEKLFNIYQIIRSEPYKRLDWIEKHSRKNDPKSRDQIKPESTTYYRGVLKRELENYRELRKQLGFYFLPKGLKSPKDFEEKISKRLKNLGSKDTSTIYETKSHKSDHKWPK